jgi:hypothetical protein
MDKASMLPLVSNISAATVLFANFQWLSLGR